MGTLYKMKLTVSVNERLDQGQSLLLLRVCVCVRACVRACLCVCV